MSDDSQYAKGFIPRDFDTHPHGSLVYAAPFNIPTIPRDEWPDRIADMERTKTRLSDIADQAGVPRLNQESLGYCHCFCLAYAIMAFRAAMGLPFKLLSASSIGGPVTSFQNRGAYVFDDLEQAVNVGICEARIYPMTTTSRQYYTEEARQNAALHKVTEWFDLQPRNYDQYMTCLLSRIPVPFGFNEMGHAMTGVDPVNLGGGKFGSRVQNSWVPWQPPGDDRGRKVWSERELTPDEQYAPRQITGA